MNSGVVVFQGFVLCLLSIAQVGEKAVRRQVVIGCVVENSLYTARDYQDKLGWFVTCVSSQSLQAATGKEEATRESYLFTHSDWHGNHLRWTIRNNIFWNFNSNIEIFKSCVCRVPLEVLARFRADDDHRHQDEYFLKAGNEYPNWIPRPAIEATTRTDSDKLFVDFLPLADDEGLLFVLEENRMRVWRGRAVFNKEAREKFKRWTVKWTEAQGEATAVPFSEPFHVFGDEASWYLLTRSGLLYVSRRSIGRDRKVELFYGTKPLPLLCLITDTASGQTFAFAWPSKGNENTDGAFFELREEVRLNRFDFSRTKPGFLGDPRKVAFECARILVDQGKIKLTMTRGKK